MSKLSQKVDRLEGHIIDLMKTVEQNETKRDEQLREAGILKANPFSFGFYVNSCVGKRVEHLREDLTLLVQHLNLCFKNNPEVRTVEPVVEESPNATPTD